MKLDAFIKTRYESYKAPVAMTHVIYGYPTIAKSLEWMTALLEQGVDILEVQFPFSDPVADGPTIAAACHDAIAENPNLTQLLADIKKLQQGFPNSKFLLMSYLNPIYRFGITRLVEAAAEAGISGFVIGDLPPESSEEYKAACAKHQLDPIWLITPATTEERIKFIAEQASGMLYCVSRSGVTGSTQNDSRNDLKYTSKDKPLDIYLSSIRKHTSVPLGVGFGIRKPEQVSALADLAEVAIVGSALLNAYKAGGINGGVKLVNDLFPYLQKQI